MAEVFGYLHRIKADGEWDWNVESGQPVIFDELATAREITRQILGQTTLPDYYVTESRHVEEVELYEVRKIE